MGVGVEDEIALEIESPLAEAGMEIPEPGVR